MTQLLQRNMAHHMLLARQDGNRGDRGGTAAGGGGGSIIPPIQVPPPPVSTPSTTVSSTSPTSTSPPASPSVSSKQSTPSSSVQSTTSTPPVVPTTTTSSSTSIPPPTSKASSTPTSSSTTSSRTLSTSSVSQHTTIPTFANPTVNTDLSTPTFSITDGTATDVYNPGATTSAPALNSSASSNLSAGSIVGAVAGTLIGLVALVFFVIFILRRYRRARRRALHDSDFGTFRRSMFVTSRSSATMPSMTESHHNVAPSINDPYVAYPATTAQPPSQSLGAATAASGILQERPKYVYGQDPTPANQQPQNDDSASDAAHGGVYSSEPQAQSTYNPEAYGDYVQYNAGNGGVSTGNDMYQEAEREYRGQQGYPSQYTAYGYPQQQQQHYQADVHNAYGGM